MKIAKIPSCDRCHQHETSGWHLLAVALVWNAAVKANAKIVCARCGHVARRASAKEK